MNDLLTPIKITTIGDVERADDQQFAVTSTQKSRTKEERYLNSPQDALEVLKSKPDLDQLTRVLQRLDPARTRNDDFNIKVPGPKASPILYILVEEIIPSYWRVLKEGPSSNQSQQIKLIVRCLGSVAGIGVIITRLRVLLDSKDETPKEIKSEGVGNNPVVEDMLDVLQSVLCKNSFLLRTWEDIVSLVTNHSQRNLMWKELTSFVAGGRILSSASEADHKLNESSSSIRDRSWLGDGAQYASWLGKNIAYMITTPDQDNGEVQKALARVLERALKLGYTDRLVEEASATLINGERRFLGKYRTLMRNLGFPDPKTYLYSLIRILSRRHLSRSANEDIDREGSKNGTLNGVSALIAQLVEGNPRLGDALVDWLAGSSADGVGQSHDTHRAVIAAISKDRDRIHTALHKNLELFGDKLYIKHTPTLHQEVNAQILLMVAGYAHRADPLYVSNLARSSVYINAISNRLAASSSRASFLGMVVGTAISELVDPKDKQMTFSSDEINSPDGKWYRSLTSVNDAIGSVEDLKFRTSASKNPSPQLRKTTPANGKAAKLPATSSATSKVVSIEEIVDGSDSDEDDLPTYEKPDSDASDEDEDPTLVQRDKLTTPVYIRDLLAGLHDTENFERHQLALSTASTLIRRKATFGTEVSGHIEELATILVGLNDKYDMTDFQKWRLQGMIAVLVAQPLKMGQWFSRTYFNGDYSISQRASILTTLGLGARELAGFQKEDAALTGADAVPEDPFPSKKLPDKLQRLWALDTAPMNALSSQLEKTIIQPLALSAADTLTGPNALKVRTFSSRMAVEKARKKPVANALAKIVADGFFFPLTGLWRVHLQVYGDRTPHTSPPLLPFYLKTLALILHASGPSTLSLPQMTAELFSLLLSLRPRAATDVTVLEALLFAFLTLLDVNGNNKRGLAEQHGKELMETQGWVQEVFERVGGGGEEGEKVRMLAAGVLVRCREVVEEWQRVMVGEMADFM